MRIFLFLTVLFIANNVFAQQGNWIAQIHRSDGNNIPFTFNWKIENGKHVWYIKNAAEKIRVDNFEIKGDSFIVQMPVFESQFRFVLKNNHISGYWMKRGALKGLQLSMSATPGSSRFSTDGNAEHNISGRWAVTFTGKSSTRKSVGEFDATGNLLTGTFLNATGDYRYLEGVVSKDSLLLSAFDGESAFLFKAKIENDRTISNGIFYSGAQGKQEWTAVKDSNAIVPLESVAMFVKPGEESLNFSFKDLAGKQVSINDARFKNKVIIVQLLGSWCPNCLDETAFLSEYYNKNRQRGVEIIGLAYEYSTDWNRTIRSLKKLQQRFNVQYSILNTEVTVQDSLRTEKTLPQLTPIKVFPSSIIIDKKGKIRKLDTGFNGPGTGIHHLIYKKEFEEMMDALLNE